MLVFPPQTEEVYRVVAQDVQYGYNFRCLAGIFDKTCPHLSILRESIFAFLGLLGAALAIWYWARRLASQFWPKSADAGLERAILRSVPAVLAVAFLLTAAWGVYSAIPFTPGGPKDAVLNVITERKAIAQVGLSPTARQLSAMRETVEVLILPTNVMNIMAGLLAAVAVSLACLLPRAKSPADIAPASRWERRGPVLIFLILVTAFAMAPVSIPQFIGSVGLLGLFLMCATAILSQLSALSSRYEIPFLFLLSCWMLLLSWSGINNDHIVETGAVSSKGESVASSANRSFNELLAEWYESRPDRNRYVSPKRYPLYIVAAQGGGIYAAYDTARVLGVLQDRCAAFGSHTFAISGVSGGSVGASVFVSLLKLKAPTTDPARCKDQTKPNSELFADGGSLANRASQILDHDLLSPLISGLLFGDVLQSVLPRDFPVFDRARALDRSLESAFDTPTDLASGGPTSMLAPPKNPLRNSFASHWHAKAQWPALLLNTTDVRSGERRIMAPFDFGRDPQKMLPVSGNGELANIKLSTAAFLSARFPWVTPSAWFRDKSGNITYLVDGGYYDNSGLVTAQELMAAIKTSDLKDKVEPKLIILTGAPGAVDPIGGLHEPLDPIRAMLNSWGTRPVEAIRSADQTLNISPDAANTVRILRLHGLLYNLPLGWRLSGGTVDLISVEDPLPGQCRGDGNATDKTNVFDADCLLKDLEKELL
ncbi:hypothetical protein HAP41_0000043175 [Bradyrhizobium barranii subsp. apii]|uniref:Uncharacterized protein n=1 Tax=Bradyrhizobium barranii subsp. apii TaxID=2819348 RepID=A0A8T5V6N1_9BRAD|nr:hypothetical protein [Bradyrhizobium barranii]UPT86950.1 hypothetical protein HAP41_0000043175 [Bradyrhizobium barranii subsp. apii]